MIPNLEYYRVFYTVAIQGSFTAAANILMTSQPALSRSIKLLEEEIGCELFKRTSRGVRLTPEGEQLMVFVSKAHEEMAKAEELMLRLNDFSEGYIKISASATALLTYLLGRIRNFRDIYPNVKMNILNNNSFDSVEILKNGEVDFAVVSTSFPHVQDLKGVRLKSVKDVLLGGEKFRGLEGRELSIEEISKYPLVAVTEGTAIRRFYDRLFLDNHCVLTPEIEVASVELLLPTIRHNLGLGFVPEVYLETYGEDECVKLKVREEIPEREIWLLYREDDSLSIAAKKFMEFLS